MNNNEIFNKKNHANFYKRTNNSFLIIKCSKNFEYIGVNLINGTV